MAQIYIRPKAIYERNERLDEMLVRVKRFSSLVEVLIQCDPFNQNELQKIRQRLDRMQQNLQQMRWLMDDMLEEKRKLEQEMVNRLEASSQEIAQLF